jgi:hypothetical protein
VNLFRFPEFSRSQVSEASMGTTSIKFSVERLTKLSHNLQAGGPEFSVGVLSPRQVALTEAKKSCLLPHIPGQGP